MGNEDIPPEFDSAPKWQPPLGTEGEPRKEPGGEPPTGPAAAQVLIGVAAEACLSGIAWPMAFTHGDAWLFPTFAVLVVVKLFGSGIWMAIDGRASFFGLGMMLSIPLGGLIFFCTCGAAFSNALRH